MEHDGTCSDRSWDAPLVIKALPMDWNVFDYASKDKFPMVGLEKTAYIDLEENLICRWDSANNEYVTIGGNGEVDYEQLQNLPQIENVTLIGNKTAGELGLAKAEDVEEIEEKIPDQASAENKLADKNFVNSSIATNTANYIYKTVEGRKVPFNSLAELEAYSGALTNNDYAFVVGTDSTGNTIYTRYKYNANEASWAEEYVLNNSSFTAAQWAAINSGITEGKIEALDDDVWQLGHDVTELNTALSAETSAREAGDDLIDAKIDARVPAPTAADVDKFLKGDGTWAEAGGIIKVLSADDYDYKWVGTDGVALWRLNSGLYFVPTNVYAFGTASGDQCLGIIQVLVRRDGQYAYIASIDNSIASVNPQCPIKSFLVRVSNGNKTGDYCLYFPADNLTTTDSRIPLSASQGKVLKGLVDAKQDQITAGFGITMSGNTIAVDDVDVASVEYVDASITDTMNFIIQERDAEKAGRVAGDELINAKIDARVPEPTAADVDKFLKGDGTWAEAGGGGGVILGGTTAPTTETVGVVSQLYSYYDTENETPVVAMCTKAEEVEGQMVYTWVPQYFATIVDNREGEIDIDPEDGEMIIPEETPIVDGTMDASDISMQVIDNTLIV